MEKETESEAKEEKVEVEVKAEKPTETTKAKKKSFSPFFFKGTLIGVLVVAVLFVITFGIGIYQYQWNNDITKNVVKILPYPVLMVDGNFVSYREFLDDNKALRKFSDMQEQLTGEEFYASDDKLKQVVLTQFINREIIENALADYDVEFTDSDIEEEFVNVLAQQGGDEEALVEQLQEVYGWNLDEFKDKIIRFGLMEAKLSEKIRNDDDIDLNKKAKEKAEGLLARIKAGESYDVIAGDKTLNDDEVSAAKEGDIGFVERGMLVPAFEDVAFAMNPGDLSELVETEFGYHIIKMEERKAATDDTPESIRVKNILVRRVSLKEFLDAEKEEASIWKFVNTSEWPEL